ncbi:MAG: metal-dependent hydrolase [Desulfovibrionaceae bacterium]|nr:metal-dependent hydrolase [Desulfovibrionaceae bacterium]
MKWITHEVGAVGLAVTLQLPLTAVVAAFFGGILPDVFDQRVARVFSRSKKGQQRVFGAVHRGLSHWFGLYLALLFMVEVWPLPLLLQEVIWGLGLGAASHVLLDMLTPKGVPLLPFSRKLRLACPICSTGTWREYLFLALMTLTWLIVNREACFVLLGRLQRFLGGF